MSFFKILTNVIKKKSEKREALWREKSGRLDHLPIGDWSSSKLPVPSNHPVWTVNSDQLLQ